MTTPRDDIAGLSERLSETIWRAKEFGAHDWLLKPMEEAATQLDSLLKERDALQARVKELEDEIQRRNFIRAMTGPDLHDKAETWHAQATEFANRADEAESRALRAEQERDEAIGLVKSGLDIVSEERGWGTYPRMEGSDIYIEADAFRDTARDLVRRLAGPEKA